MGSEHTVSRRPLSAGIRLRHKKADPLRGLGDRCGDLSWVEAFARCIQHTLGENRSRKPAAAACAGSSHTVLSAAWPGNRLLPPSSSRSTIPAPAWARYFCVRDLWDDVLLELEKSVGVAEEKNSVGNTGISSARARASCWLPRQALTYGRSFVTWSNLPEFRLRMRLSNVARL